MYPARRAKDILDMNAQDRHLKDAGTGPMEGQTEAARKVLASLFLARKNFSLYPEGHTICMNTLEQFRVLLETYLHKYGDLKLDIEKDRFVSEGEVIYSGPPEEGTLPFALFRDGIRWMEFTDGIDTWEIKEIIRIINKYSMLSNEPDGDIVTAFWEAQFPHVKYDVSEFFWGAEEEVNLKPFSGTQEKSPVSPGEKKPAEPEPLPNPPIDQTSIVITPQEQARIQEMVSLEEEADPTAYLDALFDSLLQHREKENFEIILEVLGDEFQNSLARKEFAVTLKILQSLQYVLNNCVSDIPWAGPFIEDFFLTVSGSEFLAPLQEVWKDIDSGQAGQVKQILTMLQPQAFHTLGVLLLKPQSSQMRQMLVEVMISMASRDMCPLEALLKNPDEKLVERLVHVLVKLEGERPLKELMKLVRHPSVRVRQDAVKGIMQRGPAHIKDIFALIDDKDESIRRLVLKQMGQAPNQVVEGLLLDYLENRKFKSTESEHIIACFITLGQCGSSRSVPFLRKTLLSWGWMPGFWRSAYRQGAAAALVKMRAKEAQQALKDASRSLSISVRHIVRKAMQG